MKKSELLTIRLTPEIIKSLDEVAVQHGVSRAALARNILANCGYFYNFLETEAMRQPENVAKIENEMIENIEKSLPEGITPTLVNMMGEMMKRVMHEVAQKLIGEIKGGENSEK